MSALDELVAAAHEDLERRRAEVPNEALEAQLDERDAARPFGEALRSPGVALVAEFKRRSPSAGELAAAELADVASAYERGGARALSVLTDERSFGGSLEDLGIARRASKLPILRKDFIVDRYQLYEAAVAGADAVLLIVAALSEERLLELHSEAHRLELECLVEVHDAEDLERALALDCELIGINNRDLRDLSVRLETTRELRRSVPAAKTVVAESGYENRAQIAELERIDVDAVLIGEALLRAGDPEAMARELVAGEDTGSRHT